MYPAFAQKTPPGPPHRPLLHWTYLPVLVTIISLVNSLNLVHKSASSSVSLISLSDASPFSLPFWNSLSTALRRCSRRWSELEEVIFPSSVDRPKSKMFSAGSHWLWDSRWQREARPGRYWFLNPKASSFKGPQGPHGEVGRGLCARISPLWPGSNAAPTPGWTSLYNIKDLFWIYKINFYLLGGNLFSSTKLYSKNDIFFSFYRYSKNDSAVGVKFDL